MSQIAAQVSKTPPLSNGTILRASNLKKTYLSGDATITVLKQANLSLRQGEFVAIEGRSGSGKSTLLHILAGLDNADSGSIEFGGFDLASVASRVSRHQMPARGWFAWLRAFWTRPFNSLLILNDSADRALARIRNTQFGFVFQFYHLLPELDVIENTLLGPMIDHSLLSWRDKKTELRARAGELLSQLGLGHRLTHRPNQLSGGERQRVAIARALMNNPKILFADEPTGNLDYETGRQIMGVLEKLHREQGQTIVMVTHDRSLAREADRVLVLRDGKLETPTDTPGADKSE